MASIYVQCSSKPFSFSLPLPLPPFSQALVYFLFLLMLSLTNTRVCVCVLKSELRNHLHYTEHLSSSLKFRSLSNSKLLNATTQDQVRATWSRDGRTQTRPLHTSPLKFQPEAAQPAKLLVSQVAHINFSAHSSK